MYSMILPSPATTPIRDANSEAAWFALRVKPQHERTVSYALHQKGFERYVPLYRARRRWSDRLKEIELPLFQGYVFCRMSADKRAAVLTTPGVYGFVGFSGTPAPIAERELQMVRRMLSAGAPVGPWPFLKAGQPVQITRGPLAGLEGILAGTPDGWHVVVNVNILQRSVAVTVERDQFAPVNALSSAAAAVAV